MAKYKTEVEAFQMTEKRGSDVSGWPDWLREVWSEDTPTVGAVWPEGDGRVCLGTETGALVIDWDDYIVLGDQGLYVRKPNEFEKAYTPVTRVTKAVKK